jgi:hypothetical protein
MSKCILIFFDFLPQETQRVSQGDKSNIAGIIFFACICIFSRSRRKEKSTTVLFWEIMKTKPHKYFAANDYLPIKMFMPKKKMLFYFFYQCIFAGIYIIIYRALFFFQQKIQLFHRTDFQ